MSQHNSCEISGYFIPYSKPWRIGHLKGESDGKKRCYFLGCIPGTPRPTIYQCLFQLDDSISNWLAGLPGTNFPETLRPLFVGTHGNPFKTWSPRSNTNFDKSWMFWRCHDASVDIFKFMFFTAPQPVGVPYEKKNKGW